MKDSKRWVQHVKCIKVSDAVEEVKTAIESFTSHIFRSDYQQRMQNNIISDLPIDHLNLQIIHYQYDSCYLIAIQTFIEVGWFMVFNATFNNISVISWQHYSHMDEICSIKY
jgi:hypothetical protein